MSCTIWNRIKALDLPGRVKRELLALWRSARRLVEAILCFLARHRHFTHCLLLGAIVCWLLCTIPLAIAHFLGLLALIGCAAIGLAQELQEHFLEAFGGVTQVKGFTNEE